MPHLPVGVLYFLLAIFGLIVGSFISMWSYRAPRSQSIGGRSRCPHCGKTIGIFENIPFLYYLISGGRCKNCKGKISKRYPLIEMFTVFTFLLTGYFVFVQARVPDIFLPLGDFALPVILLVLTFLITLLVVDIEEQILPDEVTFALGTVVFLLAIFPSGVGFFSRTLAGFLSFSLFLFVYLVTRGRGMGFGDVKLVFPLGMLLGFSSLITFLNLAFVSGAMAGLFLVVVGKAKFGRQIAFGPFLITSAWITLFFGEEMGGWYFGLL